MRLHFERRSITLVAGAYSDLTQPLSGFCLAQTLVVPSNTGNTYDFKITNSFGDVVFQRLSQVGRLSEVDHMIPLDGRVTFSVANATVAADKVTLLLGVRGD